MISLLSLELRRKIKIKRFVTTSYDILYSVPSTNWALSFVAILIRK